MATEETTFNVLPLSNQGNTSTTFVLSGVTIIVELTFNYIISCWSMNIYDTSRNLLSAGLILVPNVDLLLPYPALGQLIGHLVIVEQTDGDYMNPDKLGDTVQLLWYPPGTEVELP
jgi:hypothetical protein